MKLRGEAQIEGDPSLINQKIVILSGVSRGDNGVGRRELIPRRALLRTP